MRAMGASLGTPAGGAELQPPEDTGTQTPRPSRPQSKGPRPQRPPMPWATGKTWYPVPGGQPRAPGDPQEAAGDRESSSMGGTGRQGAVCPQGLLPTGPGAAPAPRGAGAGELRAPRGCGRVWNSAGGQGQRDGGTAGRPRGPRRHWFVLELAGGTVTAGAPLVSRCARRVLAVLGHWCHWCCWCHWCRWCHWCHWFHWCHSCCWCHWCYWCRWCHRRCCCPCCPFYRRCPSRPRCRSVPPRLPVSPPSPPSALGGWAWRGEGRGFHT